MIEYMVLSAPRSGTAWASVWLSTVEVPCWHEPTWDIHHEDLDTQGRLGITSTELVLYPEWVAQHAVPKLILHRPADEVNRSLQTLGLGRWKPKMFELLRALPGMHVDWKDLFKNPKPIYQHLIGRPMDEARHARLKFMKITMLERFRAGMSNEIVRNRYRENPTFYPWY